MPDDFTPPTCTECGKVPQPDRSGGYTTHGRRVHRGREIIAEGEQLCSDCARQRDGFRTLGDIHEERRRQLRNPKP